VGTTRALTGEQTLRGYTVNGALAVGAAHERGRIKPGFVADFALWQEDPSLVAAADVTALPVLRTISRGRTVFRA
jgi:predicted amidohydrolase YtcJ